jgi:hypothetical protein
MHEPTAWDRLYDNIESITILNEKKTKKQFTRWTHTHVRLLMCKCKQLPLYKNSRVEYISEELTTASTG